MSNDQPNYVGAFLAGLGIAWLIIFVVVWLVNAFVAGLVAPKDRATTFFWITLLILGPLGVLAASVAQSREPLNVEPPARPIAAGRRRFICPKCGAENDIPKHDASYDCWRCSEHRTVQRIETVAKATSAKAAATHAGKNLADEIDSKVADFEAGRISLAELEAYLDRAEASQARRTEASPTGKE
jgi:DNA-directed RNA polymerase subunit RPC12/RpoP